VGIDKGGGTSRERLRAPMEALSGCRTKTTYPHQAQQISGRLQLVCASVFSGHQVDASRRTVYWVTCDGGMETKPQYVKNCTRWVFEGPTKQGGERLRCDK